MPTQKTHTNRLINEKSPYLLQHAHNPVDWYPWGDEAFEKAKSEDKPVFLSIGYSTCHWCHVMERESFEDEEVAAILNAHFVSIKVDREERPDVDNFYMNACVAVGGSGGWPLSSFLMPDRRPFFSGTYFPKEDGRYGTGFITILKRIAELWRDERPELLSISGEILAHCGRQAEGTGKAEIDDACTDRAFRQLQANFDRKYGGFGGAPKFPSPQNLIYLLRYGAAEHQPAALEMVKTTLDAMRAGGIYDQIGGGFSRYSTDARWLVPHFEKMMVDNALHILTYAQAGALINPSYFNTVRELVDFCAREMLHPDGGFFTALDADSEGEEGKYYVFTPAQVKSVLGKEDGGRLCALLDITPGGNFEGKSIPNLIGKNLSENDRMFLYNANQKLLPYRSGRIPPYKDDKVAAAVNGFMIAALALAGSIIKESAYISIAERCAEFVSDRLDVDGRLRSYWRGGPSSALASSDDYAYIVWGFIELYDATGQPVWLQRALEFTKSLDSLFWDGQNGGYFLSGSDVAGLPLRQKNLHDGAIPSGNSVAALNALRLAAICVDPGMQKRAQQILGTMAAEINDYPVGCCGALCAQLQQSRRSREIVFVNGEGFEELKSCLPAFHPFTAVAVCGPGYEKAAELAPYLAEYKPVGGKAAAFLCSGGSCRPPVTDHEAFKNLLAENPEY